MSLNYSSLTSFSSTSFGDIIIHSSKSNPQFLTFRKNLPIFPRKFPVLPSPYFMNLPLYRPLSRLHMSFVSHFSSLFSPFPDLHPSPMAAACLPLSSDPNSSLKILKFCRPTFSDHLSSLPISPNPHKINDSPPPPSSDSDLWFLIRQEARSDVEQEPILSNYYITSILSHASMDKALANHLSIKLCNSSLSSSTLFQLFSDVLTDDGGEILRCAIRDLKAVKERDPACISYVQCFLNYKGFLAVQSHRIAHKLWNQGRKVLAMLIQNRVSEAFAVDIHPGAKIGCGILLDHATGVVVGETAVIGNDVSILHHVTLGGTGKDSGDRHPKIGDGVLIGAGTCILGNIKIGDGAKIGAGSVVLKDVPPRTTAVGNPARLVGGKVNPIKLDKTPSFTMDHTSHISEWSDYVI